MMETSKYVDSMQESIAVSEKIGLDPKSAKIHIYSILQRERAIQARMNRYKWLLDRMSHAAGCDPDREEDEFALYERLIQKVHDLQNDRFISLGVQRTEAGAHAFKLWIDEQNRLAKEDSYAMNDETPETEQRPKQPGLMAKLFAVLRK